MDFSRTHGHIPWPPDPRRIHESLGKLIQLETGDKPEMGTKMVTPPISDGYLGRGGRGGRERRERKEGEEGGRGGRERREGPPQLRQGAYPNRDKERVMGWGTGPGCVMVLT